MAKFVIDVNLPYYFKLWNTCDFVHQLDIEAKATDKEIWEFAKNNRMLMSSPPPKAIHIRFGNKKMSEFHELLNTIWPEILSSIENNKLINVFIDRVEGIQ